MGARLRGGNRRGNAGRRERNSPAGRRRGRDDARGREKGRAGVSRREHGRGALRREYLSGEARVGVGELVAAPTFTLRVLCASASFFLQSLFFPRLFTRRPVSGPRSTSERKRCFRRSSRGVATFTSIPSCRTKKCGPRSWSRIISVRLASR